MAMFLPKSTKNMIANRDVLKIFGISALMTAVICLLSSLEMLPNLPPILGTNCRIVTTTGHHQLKPSVISKNAAESSAGATNDWEARLPFGIEAFLPENAARQVQKRTCSLVKGRRLVAAYADRGNFIVEARRSCHRALQNAGIDACLIATPDFLDDDFRRQNAHILNQSRGGGYWIWKPYLLFRLMVEVMNEDDVLLYIDSDAKLVQDMEDVICVQAQAKQDIVLTHQDLLERHWTKADAFVLMGVESLQPNVSATIQIYGKFVLLRKSISSLRFVTEYLTYAQDARIVTDLPSRLSGEASDFRENRHDQTILSLLSKKWNIPIWPHAWGEWYSSGGEAATYPTFNRFKAENYPAPRSWPMVKWGKVDP